MAIVLELIRDSIQQQHEAWDKALSDLTPDQLHFRPNNRGNHIGFITWHYVRTEDNIVQFVFQNRKPTVWVEGGYDQKFGLPRTAQGTGMAPAEAAQMQFPALEQWMAYQHGVWQATDSWLNSLTEADLQRIVSFKPFGDIPLMTAVRIPILNHGFMHIGQAQHLRQLQGLKGSDM
jgi:DinB family protein